MISKTAEKEEAIRLRKEGKSYSEILKYVKVAKSTLSLWLLDVGLSKKQFQRLTQKKLDASKRGGQAKHQQRVERTQEIWFKALKDISHITHRELWLIGIVLYWAEGSKEKEYHPGSRVQFGNSDPRMIKLFIKWLTNVCKVPVYNIGLEIYIHENSKNNIDTVKQFWSKAIGFPLDKLTRVYFKKNKIKTNRKNVGELYYGGLRVTVKASSTLLRRITGWTEAIVRNVE